MLKIKGEHTDQSAKPKTLNYNNPAFDRERLERGYSFSFTLPHTPKNLRLLENKTRFDAKDRTIPNSSFDIGKQLTSLKGVTYINQVGTTASSVTFRNISLDLAIKAEQKKIRDFLPVIDLGFSGFTYYFDIPSNLGNFPEITLNGVRIVSPIFPDANNLETVRDYFIDQINLLVPGVGATVPPTTDRFQIRSTEYKDVTITDVLYLTYTKIQPIGERVSDIFEAHFEDIMQNPVETHSFPMIHMPNFYGEENPDFLGFANNATDTGGVFKLLPNLWYNQGEKRAQNTVIPMVRVKYLLDQFAQSVGLDGLAGDFDTDAEWQQLTIYNNLALDNFKTDIPDSALEYKTRNIFVTKYDLAEHVPDVTVRELLNIISSLGFCFLVKNNRLHINLVEKYLDSKVLDLTPYTDAAISIFSPEKKGATIRYIDDRKQNQSPDLAEYVINQGEQLITLPFRPLPEEVVYNSHSKIFVRLCTTTHAGSSPAFSYNEDYPFAFLFSRGLQPALNQSGVSIRNYLQSATLNVDTAGATNANYSLSLQGTAGLMSQMLLTYFELIENDEVTIQTILPPAVVSELILFRNLKIKIYHPNGVLFFILKSISAQTGKERMRVTLVGHRL